jgi:glycosyl transferase, family 25
MNPGTENIDQVLHNFFDRVFVLTVPRFTGRQKKVKERLGGIPFEFFFGVDKNDLTPDFIGENYKYEKRNSLAVRQQFKPLNPGEIACSLSHRLLYQAMLDNNWQKILILEDDVVPDREKLTGLGKYLQELPADWELLYLGYLKNERPTLIKRLKRGWYTMQSLLGLSRMPSAMIQHILPRKFSHSLMKAGFHDCTHAYALTINGARKLLSAQTPVHYRADNLLSALIMKNQLNAFITREQLFNQEIFFDRTDKSYIRTDPQLNTE